MSMGFGGGWAPGAAKRMFIYFSVPIVAGVALIKLFERSEEHHFKQAKKDNPELVRKMHSANAQLLENIKKSNENFKDELKASWPYNPNTSESPSPLTPPPVGSSASASPSPSHSTLSTTTTPSPSPSPSPPSSFSSSVSSTDVKKPTK
eukprot:TRINITY_DN1421_c0_g1_i1.p1 TRINITY_DN1421_c0_g1~~TRINITY_DN1421_c0_g1_i1.p1  ORF type:complete len:149 (+),score=57.13 TRINITY_DN1421_c0_g1_i1:36-482(+)